MAENPCYKLVFSHCLAPNAFLAESILGTLTPSFLLWKMGISTVKQHSTSLPKSINPREEARVSGNGVRQMPWSGSLPGGLEKIKRVHSGNETWPEDSLRSRGGGQHQGSLDPLCFSLGPTFRSSAVLPIVARIKFLSEAFHLSDVSRRERSVGPRPGVLQEGASPLARRHVPGVGNAEAASTTSSPAKRFITFSKTQKPTYFNSFLLKTEGSPPPPPHLHTHTHTSGPPSAGARGPTLGDGKGWKGLSGDLFRWVPGNPQADSVLLQVSGCWGLGRTTNVCLPGAGAQQGGSSRSVASILVHLMLVCDPQPRFFHL